MPVQEKLHYCNSLQEAGARVNAASRGRAAREVIAPARLPQPGIEAEDGSLGSKDVSIFEEVCRK